MNTLAIVKSVYQTVSLNLLDESSTNPRRTFEPSKLNELADSIRAHGLIQPITVRRRDKRFEIVAGARRFRAAQIAEQDEVPVRILDLDDAQTLEVQINWTPQSTSLCAAPVPGRGRENLAVVSRRMRHQHPSNPPTWCHESPMKRFIRAVGEATARLPVPR